MKYIFQFFKENLKQNCRTFITKNKSLQPRKNNGGGGLSVADGQADGFIQWVTTNPLTTAAAASGSSVDSQTISGGPPLTHQLMYMAVDEMVLSC